MKCAIPECQETKTLYNIKAAAITAGVADAPEWRCVNHIPKNMTFPIGLHGAERIKAGFETG